MGVDIAGLKQGVFDWASAAADPNQVIWDRPNIPRPRTEDYLYATLSFLTGPVRVGGQDAAFINDLDQMEVRGFRQLTISVIVYGNDKVNVLQLASDLQSSLHQPSVLQGLDASGLSVIEQGSVADISALLETGFEERAQLDVLFGVCASDIDTKLLGPLVEEAEVGGMVENPKGDTVKTNDPNKTTEQNEDLGPGLIDSTP